MKDVHFKINMQSIVHKGKEGCLLPHALLPSVPDIDESTVHDSIKCSDLGFTINSHFQCLLPRKRKSPPNPKCVRCLLTYASVTRQATTVSTGCETSLWFQINNVYIDLIDILISCVVCSRQHSIHSGLFLLFWRLPYL